MTASDNNVLRHFAQCPACEAAYGSAKVSVVAQRGERTAFHVTCPSCKTSTLLTVLQGPAGVMGLGAITDLTRQELQRLKQPPIGPDAVLDLHVQLRTYTGTLAAVLGARTGSRRVQKVRKD